MEPRRDACVVSVVIPARNEAATIRRAIEPLLVDPPAPLEIIVADGGSDDGMADVVRAMADDDPRIRLVDNPGRVTPEGLNTAIRASRGDVIVRMDGHAEPSAGYLAACLRVLEGSGAWNVGGRMIKSGATAAGRAASAAATSPFGIGGGARHHTLDDARDIDTVWLGCWPRWVFERVGLFDPEMVQDQDEELNQRIRDAGGTVRFDPSIQVAYLSRASWRGLFRQHFRYGFYKVRAIQKRPGLLRVRHAVPGALVAALAVAAALVIADPRALVLVAVIIGTWLAAAWWFARRVAAPFRARTVEVMAAYGCMHIGYGLGAWAGFVRFAHRWIVDREGAAPRLPVRST